MRNYILIGCVIAAVVGCDSSNDPVIKDDAGSDASLVDSGISADADLTSQVCKDNCGTFTVDSVKYDCPVACPISQTCGVVKHKCCVEIQNKLDLFCKYYPYYNSTFEGAGSTPSHDSATRIPSPDEVGFIYCSYPGFVNCSQY